MIEQVITLETAKLAKERGFKIETYKGYYRHGTDTNYVPLLLWVHSENEEPDFGYAPTQSLLQKWLREVHNIHVEGLRQTGVNDSSYVFYVSTIQVNNKKKIVSRPGKTYEIALEVGLQEGLKLIK